MPGETHSRGRGDTDMDAWILGTGVPSLASALYLITEAKMPPNRVHMLEAVSKADGSTVNGGDAENGYQYRGGMMFPLTDVHIANLLSMIPSEHEAGKTLVDDILESSGMGTGTRAVKGLPRTRFLVEKGNGISCVGPKHVSLGLRDHVDMFRFAAKSERSLGRSTVQDHFHNGFFRSNYWLVLATTYVSALGSPGSPAVLHLKLTTMTDWVSSLATAQLNFTAWPTTSCTTSTT